MEKLFDINGKEFTRVEDKKVLFNENKYIIYEIGNDKPEVNTISIDGKTLELKRSEKYEGQEVGYVIEAIRINENAFKCETIWLQVEEMGWSEAEYVDNKEEILFVQNILKVANIELIF